MLGLRSVGIGFVWVMAGAMACQRVPEPDTEPAGSTGSVSEVSTGIADSSGGSGLPADPTVCIPGLEVAVWSDLSDLAGVEIVSQDLDLHMIEDDDLQWVQCLRRVEGELRVRDNPQLTSLGGLENLEQVTSTLEIFLNPRLTDVDGLSGLREVGELMVHANEELQDLAGLGGLEQAEAVRVIHSPRVTGVDLPNITELSGLSLFDNEEMTSAQLPALTRVEWTADIRDLPALTDLSGFPSLEEVDDLRLRQLPLPSTTEELSSLRAVRWLLIEDMNLETVRLEALERAENLAIMQVPTVTVIDLPVLTELGSVAFSNLSALTEIPDFTATQGLVGIYLHGLPAVTTLDWLPPLEDPAWSIQLQVLPMLADLSALAGITAAERIHLRDLPALASIDELSSLQTVNSHVTLEDLPLVDSLVPLSSLESVEGHLTVENLDALPSLAGLSSLTSTGAGLYLRDNDTLSSTVGLDSLTTVQGTVQIRANGALADLEGLGSLELVERDLQLVDNPSLADIDGIWPAPVGVLGTVGQMVVITGNPSLSQCTVDDFITALTATGWANAAETGDNLSCP